MITGYLTMGYLDAKFNWFPAREVGGIMGPVLHPRGSTTR